MIRLGSSFSAPLQGAWIQEGEDGLSKVSIAKCDHLGVPSTKLLMKWLSVAPNVHSGCMHCAHLSVMGHMGLPDFWGKSEEEEETLPELPLEMIDLLVKPEIIQYLESEDIDGIYRFYRDPLFRNGTSAALREKLGKTMTVHRYIVKILKKRASQAAVNLLLTYQEVDLVHNIFRGAVTPFATLKIPHTLADEDNGGREDNHSLTLLFFRYQDRLIIAQFAKIAPFLDFSSTPAATPITQFPEDLVVKESKPWEQYRYRLSQITKRKSVVELSGTHALRVVFESIMKQVMKRCKALRSTGKTVDIRDDPWFSVTFWRSTMLHLASFWYYYFIGENASEFYKSGLLNEMDERDWWTKKGFGFTSRAFTRISPDRYRFVRREDSLFVQRKNENYSSPSSPPSSSTVNLRFADLHC